MSPFVATSLTMCNIHPKVLQLNGANFYREKCDAAISLFHLFILYFFVASVHRLIWWVC